jgi:5-(carboxyamino)imidazole ribonucleotide synthase
MVAPAAVMLNVIGRPGTGDPATYRARALEVPGVHVHLYGKAWRPGRKLGHITALGDDIASATQAARRGLELVHGGDSHN